MAETLALVLAAAVTGAAALRTQTATSIADVAGGVFLLIGVLSSDRAADQRHPLGYGRERFFWSLIAAIGVFVGGFGVALAETVQACLDPRPVGSFDFGYAVLGTLIVLDSVSLAYGIRPLVRRAAQRGTTFRQLLWRGSDPSVTTVVLTSAAGVIGSLLALVGLAGREVTGSAALDASASAMIGVVLLATSVVLLHTNRELLTGRGLPPAEIAMMQHVVADQPGVVAVPDLFAIVIGPSSLIVDGDVVFDDELSIPGVEASIVAAAAALRTIWPSVSYVYLNPVAVPRARRVDRGEAVAPASAAR